MSHDARDPAAAFLYQPAPLAAQQLRESRSPCASPYVGNLQNLALFLRHGPVRPLLYPEQSTHVGDAGYHAGGKT